MIEFLAERCPKCNGMACELLAGSVYPPFRIRCRGCGKRLTVMSDGHEARVVQVDAPQRILAASSS